MSVTVATTLAHSGRRNFSMACGSWSDIIVATFDLDQCAMARKRAYCAFRTEAEMVTLAEVTEVVLLFAAVLALLLAY
jgi:hypothetical protein